MVCNSEKGVVCESGEFTASSVTRCMSIRDSFYVAYKGPSCYCIVDPLCFVA